VALIDKLVQESMLKRQNSLSGSFDEEDKSVSMDYSVNSSSLVDYVSLSRGPSPAKSEAECKSFGSTPPPSQSSKLEALPSSLPKEMTSSSASASRETTPMEFDQLITSDFPFSCQEFFDKFISEASPVFSFQEFHKMRGDTDFKMSSWQKDEKLGYSRDLSFVSPLKSTLLHYS